MDLILWRHAHAEPLAANQSDSERKLTQKGQKQASKMAEWLNLTLPKHCKILVSPSKRTIQTASALGRQFNINDEVGITSNVQKILAVCDWPYCDEPVLLVGHQPQLGQIVNTLIPNFCHVEIRKANVWWISRKGDGEEFAPFLKAVMTPELFLK